MAQCVKPLPAKLAYVGAPVLVLAVLYSTRIPAQESSETVQDGSSAWAPPCHPQERLQGANPSHGGQV